MRIKREPLRTFLIMTRGTARANLTERDFDPGVWTKIPGNTLPDGVERS
ncbi:MAG: hypothetical protein ABSH28_10920 [Acidobacteriota bacterium]